MPEMGPETRPETRPEMRPEHEDAGARMYALVEELYPICRSITGDGVRDTLARIERALPAPMIRTEVPSGTPVLDWTVPDEWNIRDAWIADARGARVVDFRACNLHVVNYSVPVRARMTLAELRPHLHALPDHPDWIPYRTSYYAPTWGFCLTQRQLDALADGDYEVCIDSTLAPGHLSYGELVLPGEAPDEAANEVLLSTHVCHPSLCNDNLSGIAVATALARELAARPRRRWTYRFVFAPGTIGAITWLAQHRDVVPRIRAGLTIMCVGSAHPFTYKRTLAGDAEIDRAAAIVLRDRGAGDPLIDFFPYGYDERQYNSPGFRAPVGSVMRGRHGMFPEYHTSADDLGFVSAERLAESLAVVRGIVDVLEANRRTTNLAPYGEPQLGKRGLYRATGGTNIPDLNLAMLWVLQLSDGGCDLVAIAERAKLPFATIRAAADHLRDAGLLAER
jgi:aminopeptidase-like protein